MRKVDLDRIQRWPLLRAAVRAEIEARMEARKAERKAARRADEARAQFNYRLGNGGGIYRA